MTAGKSVELRATHLQAGSLKSRTLENSDEEYSNCNSDLHDLNDQYFNGYCSEHGR